MVVPPNWGAQPASPTGHSGVAEQSPLSLPASHLPWPKEDGSCLVGGRRVVYVSQLGVGYGEERRALTSHVVRL